MTLHLFATPPARTRRHPLARVGAALGAAVVLGACGASDMPPPPPVASAPAGIVGKPFVLQKTDGLQPYSGIDDMTAGDVPVARPAIVQSGPWQAPPPEAARRQRSVMEPAVLDNIDRSRRARANRNYRPVTTQAELNRR